MLLPDHHIREAIENGQIGIWPFDPKLVQPASYDLTLGNQFKVQYDHGDLVTTYHADVLILPPQRLVIATTREKVRIPSHLMAQVSGKSSFAREGVFIHITAGFIDPGFIGQITLELYSVNKKPRPIYVGKPIAQISFHRLVEPAQFPYGHEKLGSHYQNQAGATPSHRKL